MSALKEIPNEILSLLRPSADDLPIGRGPGKIPDWDILADMAPQGASSLIFYGSRLATGSVNGTVEAPAVITPALAPAADSPIIPATGDRIRIKVIGQRSALGTDAQNMSITTRIAAGGTVITFGPTAFNFNDFFYSEQEIIVLNAATGSLLLNSKSFIGTSPGSPGESIASPGGLDLTTAYNFAVLASFAAGSDDANTFTLLQHSVEVWRPYTPTL